MTYQLTQNGVVWRKEVKVSDITVAIIEAVVYYDEQFVYKWRTVIFVYHNGIKSTIYIDGFETEKSAILALEARIKIKPSIKKYSEQN